MKRRRPKLPMDAEAIDRLYGLEPVFEPGEGAGEDGPLVFTSVQCPYCWEYFETRLDLSEGDTRYVEDCQVCCRPIEFVVAVDGQQKLQSVRTLRMD